MSGSRALRAGLLAFAAIQIATAVLMVAAPGTFFEEIGPYGVRNDHYMGDLATFNFALGAVLLVAAYRPRWRVPALAAALLQYALHAVNHLVDIGEAEPERLGPINFVLIAVGAALLAGLLRAAVREERGARS